MRLKLTHLLGRFAEEKIDNSGVNLDPAHPTPLFVCPILLSMTIPAHPTYLSSPSLLEFESLPQLKCRRHSLENNISVSPSLLNNGFSALFAAVNPCRFKVIFVSVII